LTGRAKAGLTHRPQLCPAPSDHPHAVEITSPDAFAIYHAQPGDEILIRPDGYLP
jgi:hypothetical protein